MMMDNSGGIWIISRLRASPPQQDLAPTETSDQRHKSPLKKPLLYRAVPCLHDAKQLLMIGQTHRNDQAPALGKLVDQRLRNRGGRCGNQNRIKRGVETKT